MARRVEGDADDWEDLPPDAGATIESLRSLGYSPPSAVADLVDNSVAAGASTVWITASFGEGADAWVAIRDDGVGMDAPALRNAMRIGSTDPLDVRPERDLGRFGFGLKTASFSQAREVTVASLTEGMVKPVVRAWDVDRVRQTGRWQLKRSASAGAARVLDDDGPTGHGTTVVWRRLTSMASEEDTAEEGRREFIRHLDEIAAHLGMVFERFIGDGRVAIRVGNVAVAAWDPFLRSNDASQELVTEKLRYQSSAVTVTPYVLPHESMLTPEEAARAGGPAGWNEQQGFYVYRGDRLITAGDWLGLRVARNDLHNLARIAVDVPRELDLSWRLDVTKASVRPPDGLRRDLLRLAEMTRKKAAQVRRFRSAPVRRRSGGRVEQLWIQKATHSGPALRINRAHPLVNRALEDAGPARSDLARLLTVLEGTIPPLLLPSDSTGEVPLSDRPAEEILAMAERIYDGFLARGMTRSEARQRLLNTEPFNLYPNLVERFR